MEPKALCILGSHPYLLSHAPSPYTSSLGSNTKEQRHWFTFDRQGQQSQTEPDKARKYPWSLNTQTFPCHHTTHLSVWD